DPRNEISDRPLTSEGHAVQLDIVNPGVRNLELKIDQVSELQAIANKLQGNKHDFIGYINYKLLKKLSELVKEDDGIIRLFFEYEEEYAKLLKSQLEYATKRELISTLKQNEVATIGKEVIIKCSNLGRELIRSIESHTKPGEVIGLLEAGADLNATEYTPDCDTALTRAIEKDNIDIIKFLLEKGANPNIASNARNRRTPLFNAVKSGSIEAVDILLTNGARTDVSKDGKTLLHYAGKSGKVEMLEFWIKRGNYDVNVKDKRNRTPLFHAVKSGSIEAVDILLTNGARTEV
uniref:Uncharacterized protein n=1 Tax=Amphimedon queenslandica TaxID=400682 RepID=A0A1X7T6R1_AMPQE